MVETLLECPQQSSKHQNKQKSIFLKSSQVSKVIKLPLSLPSEKNHVKMQVLKSVPPEHKQPKHRGLLPFPTDQICRQIQRKFLGDNSHHYQARHCTADNHSLLRAEEYTKHPPIRLNGQSNQSPSCSTTAWINGIPCPRQTQMPRHEQTLNLCAQGFPRQGCGRASSPQVYPGETSEASRTRGSQFLGLLTAATGPVPSPAASGKNWSSPCEVSLQHISFSNQVTWACRSTDARAREMGRKDRFSLFSECV